MEDEHGVGNPRSNKVKKPVKKNGDGFKYDVAKPKKKKK
jgi:hypothetical protein